MKAKRFATLSVPVLLIRLWLMIEINPVNMSRFLNTGLSTLSSIRNQFTEFTTEVLNESTQEIADPIAELTVAKKRIADLEQVLETKNNEVEKLRQSNEDLQERSSVFEFQLHQATEHYKSAIQEKEAEILHLRSKESHEPSRSRRDSIDDFSSPPLSPTAYEFETRKLKDEIKHLKAECQHWKRLVGKQDYHEKDKKETPNDDNESLALRSEMMQLRRQMDEMMENHQNELSNLHELHRNEMASFVRSVEERKLSKDDDWGQSSDWGNDDWSAGIEKCNEQQTTEERKTHMESRERELSELVSTLSHEKSEMENKLAKAQLENKRLQKTVVDLREENKQISSLTEQNSDLQKSLETLDAEHSEAVEKLLHDRKQAEIVASELKKEANELRERLMSLKMEKAGSESKLLDYGQDANNQLAQLRDEQCQLQLRYDNVILRHNQELEALNNEIDKYKNENTDLRLSIRNMQMEQSEEVERLRRDLDESEHKLVELRRELSNVQLTQSAVPSSVDEQLDDLRIQLSNAQREYASSEERNRQLVIQCRELSVAYDDLNEQYEREKRESGAVVGNNRDLHRKLDELKQDLVEYEEKYERCKMDNLHAMKQLDALTNELEHLKAEYFNIGTIQSQTKKWRSEIVRLTKELEDSLKKREELVQSVQDFKDVVDRFDEQIQRFRSENERLRRENEELRSNASGASSPSDFRRVFEDADNELRVLRRSLNEYEEALMNKEKIWREQMEALREENEVLKSHTPSTPGSGRDEASSCGTASYVHIEMPHGIEAVHVGQQSPQGSNDSGGLLVDQLDIRRDSQELNGSDEETSGLKAVVEEQRRTIEQLEERNRELNDQILQSRSIKSQSPGRITDENEAVWGSTDWGDETEIEKSTTPIPSRSDTTAPKEDSRQQLQEILDALNEKTDECERLNKELEQKRRDLKEREELVQQAYTELKGLELQVSENRKHEETLKQDVNNLTVELHRQKEEMERVQQSTNTELVQVNARLEEAQREKVNAISELDELKGLLREMETSSQILKEQLSSSREEELKLRCDVDRLNSHLSANRTLSDADNKHVDEHHGDFDTLKRRDEQLEMKLSSLRIEYDNAKRELDDLRQRYTLEKSQFMDRRKYLEEEIDRFRNEISNERSKFDMERQSWLQDSRTYAEELENLRRVEADFYAYKEEMSRVLSSNSIDLQSLMNEKEQLVVLVNDKHQENLRYHQECQRLARLLSEEQTKNQVSIRKAELRPVYHEMAVQTEYQVDQEHEQLKRRLQEMNGELELLRKESNSKSDYVLQLENRLRNDLSERDSVLRRDLSQAIQAKDRAVGELAASRQHVEQLQQQLRYQEDTCQKQGKEIERLRAHLVQIEEAYTQEAVKAEERETELRRRLRDVEQQLQSGLEFERDGNRKMTDELSDLRTELEAMAEQRDAALLQLADSQIEVERQQKALANLQTVLQHLQQERDSLIRSETNRYKQEIETIKEQKRTLEKQVLELKEQLTVSQNSLNANTALQEQNAVKDKLLAELRIEIHTRDDRCAALQAKLNELQKIRDGKIDKDVIKNIFLGYFCAPANKKPEVAHLLGAILGFSDEEFKKIELGGGSGGWLQFVRLGGQSSTQHGKSTEQSIAAQFVKFLETESEPKFSAIPMSTTFVDQRPSTSGFTIHTGPISDRSIGTKASSRSSTPGFSVDLPTFISSDRGNTPERGGNSEFLVDLLSKSNENII